MKVTMIKKLFFYSILATFMFPAAPALSATDDGKVALHYNVYAGGMKALNATLELDVDNKAYDVALEAQTEGFIGSLFPWRAKFNTSGQNGRNGPAPMQHTSESQWKKRVEVKEMQYGPDGQLLKSTEQKSNETIVNRHFDSKAAQNAVDVLTGALMMMQHTGQTEKCAGSYPVFDGKRRFNITLKDDGTDTIRESRYSSFSGEAIRCTVRVEPVAGFKKRDQKRGWMAVQNNTEAKRKPTTLWLARIDDQGPAVPVRMEIHSDYGAVVAHLAATLK